MHTQKISLLKHKLVDEINKLLDGALTETVCGTLFRKLSEIELKQMKTALESRKGKKRDEFCTKVSAETMNKRYP